MELMLFIAMTVYLIIFSQFFANVNLIFIFGIGVGALFIFNFFTHKITRIKLIFYIIDFFGFTMFWTGYLGFLGLILYTTLATALHYKVAQKAQY